MKAGPCAWWLAPAASLRSAASRSRTARRHGSGRGTHHANAREEDLVEETGQYANRDAGSIRRSLTLARLGMPT
jgi:hypothetical protein